MGWKYIMPTSSGQLSKMNFHLDEPQAHPQNSASPKQNGLPSPKQFSVLCSYLSKQSHPPPRSERQASSWAPPLIP